MNNKMWLSKLCVFIILAYFFILFEISVVQLVLIVYPIVYIWGFIALIVFITLLFLGVSYIILRSARWMFLFSIFIYILTSFAFVFMFIIQKSETTELIPKVILIGAFFVGFILTKIKILPMKFNKYFNLMNIISSFLLIALTYRSPFFATKVQLLCLSLLSNQSLKISFKSLEFTYKKTHLLLHFPLVQYLLIGLILFSTITLFASASYIEIEANNSPEIIFWSSAVETPTDEETLDLCYENDIGFVVVLREHYISDGGASERRHIEYLLNHSVITYICLGGGRDEFYLTTDNGEEFYDIFRTIRRWLIRNDFYNYENMRGFVVDAEIPKSYHTDLEDADIYEKGEYMFNQMPSQDEMKKVQYNLNKMINEINDDGKVIGIIKLPTMFDQLDGDNDYDLLSNTIYSLDLPWDFSVSMNYRTMHIPTIYDYLIQDMSDYDHTSDYEPAYLEQGQLERNIIPISQFYQEVAYEVYSSDVGVRQKNRYIFIGVFTKKFKDTSYMQNDEWKKDLDICRHFGVSKVFFYEWNGFDRYLSLTSLIRHNSRSQRWILVIPTYMITRELFVALSVIIADKLLYI